MVSPYENSQQSKKSQVEEMFNNISSNYDFLNHFLSMHIDKLWRRKAVRRLPEDDDMNVLDVATGTADFAIEIANRRKAKVVGIDISQGMLDVGAIKVKNKGLHSRIELVKADSENIPFEEGRFDAVTVAFGVRNFENLEIGLREILRVLRPGGKLIVLEFSKPVHTPFRQLYKFYFNRILPVIGRMVSKDTSAYTYLPNSVEEFPDGESFLTILAETGFVKGTFYRNTFGVASTYEAYKL